MSRPVGIPRAKVHLGDRYQVSGWVPSQAQVEAAEERTEGMVGYFLSASRARGVANYVNDLHTLARSCYLQGAQDTAMVAARMALEKKLRG